MKVGDMVKFKTDRHGDCVYGLVVEVKNPHRSVTYEVLVSWDFLEGDVGRNYSYQLEVVNAAR